MLNMKNTKNLIDSKMLDDTTLEMSYYTKALKLMSEANLKLDSEIVCFFVEKIDHLISSIRKDL